MAIQFTKDILEDKVLKAYNNNIVRFHSDNALVPKTAQIAGMGIDITLYPNPSGEFYFNFKDYVSSLINTKNFIDDTNYVNLNEIDIDHYVYDVSNGTYLTGIFTIAITLSDDSIETVNRNLHFISAVEQLDNRFEFDSTKLNVLSPLTDNIKRWVGYPFEVSFLVGMDIPDDTDIEFTGDDASPSSFTIPSRVFSLYFSDGFHEFATTYIRGFTFGLPSTLSRLNVIENCSDGIYLKFLNKKGRYSYWMFNENKNNIIPKSIGQVNNNINDISDTISQMINIGYVSLKSKLIYDDISKDDMVLVQDIFESPKLYLFIGTPNTVSTYKDWIEVIIKEKSISISDKYNHINVQIEIDLPTRDTITI